MNIKRIAHVSYKTENMSKALKFYCDGLGFHKKFELKNKNGDPWLLYLEIVPGQFLELFYDHDSLTKKMLGEDHIGYLHLSIEVEDLKQFKRDMESKGIIFDGEIGMEADHTYQLWVTDPDGNRIEFMEYTEESLQIQRSI